MAPPSPVETSHKKDGRQRRPHRFHVSCPPPPTPGRWIRCWMHKLLIALVSSMCIWVKRRLLLLSLFCVVRNNNVLIRSFSDLLIEAVRLLIARPYEDTVC